MTHFLISPTAIKTYCGSWFDILDPKAEDVTIFDIAHALANQARFNGHSAEFYSVAQHSVHVSNLVPPQFALEGLLHDAAEAYVGDMVRPLKHAPGMEHFRVIEGRVLKAIGQRFNCELEPMALPIHEADMRMIATEQRDLMIDHEITVSHKPYAFVIDPQGPEQAEYAFLERFQRLMETN